MAYFEMNVCVFYCFTKMLATRQVHRRHRQTKEQRVWREQKKKEREKNENKKILNGRQVDEGKSQHACKQSI